MKNESKAKAKQKQSDFERLASIANYLIALLVVSSSVNYMPVFRAYYVAEYGHNLASVVGLVFALLLDYSIYVYLQYYLLLREEKRASSIHALLLTLAITIMYYLHFLFYSERGENISKSAVSAGIFPMVVIILTFISKAKIKQKQEKSESEKQEPVWEIAIPTKREVKRMRLPKQEKQSEKAESGPGETGLTQEFICPICKEHYPTQKRLNAHGPDRCRRKMEEAKNGNID